MGININGTAPKKGGKVEAEKTKEAVTAQAEVKGASDACGADSDKLIFLAALADPSKDDTTTTTDKDGNQKKITTGTIVGYKFKAAVDLDVPNVAPGDDFKNNLMSYSGDIYATVHVPAGTEFNLTKFETGLLISQERFNGRATGGDKPVLCAYHSVSKISGENGQPVSKSSATAVPTIALKAINPGQSIKDYPMEDVLTFVDKTLPSGQKRKERTIKPGFEKFAPLAKETIRAPRVSTTKDPATQRNKNAEAFLAIVAAKKAN